MSDTPERANRDAESIVALCEGQLAHYESVCSKWAYVKDETIIALRAAAAELRRLAQSASPESGQVTEAMLRAGIQAAKDFGGDTTGWDREQCLRQQVQAILEAALASRDNPRHDDKTEGE